ncbi:MAG: TRL-like family protein [Bacteroidaceae bacterium]|nr:TRL-like family protein [Bacteroidaceae bacterium]
MMKKVMLIVTASGLMLLGSCTSYRPITATSAPVGNKCGTASHWSVLGIISGGSNLGINKAAKSGGISQISHVDFKTKSYLGIYTKQTVLVYGE